MIIGGQISFRLIYRQRSRFTFADCSLCHSADMTDFRTLKRNDIFYDKFAARSRNNSVIGNLSAHSCIHWCLGNEYRALFSGFQFLNNLILCRQYRNLRFVRQTVIADKFTFDGCVKRLIDCHIRSHVVGRFTRFTRCLPLLLHRLMETFFIYGKSSLFQNLNREVNRKSIGIIQLKCIFSG